MKKRILLFFFVVSFVLSPIGVLAAETPGVSSDGFTFADPLYAVDEIADEAKVTFEYVPQEQALPENAPQIGCEAAYLADPVSGKVFYEKNAHEKMYPASTTKILTALVVLENCDPEDSVVVSQNAVDAVPQDYTTARLRAGERFSVYTLLCAMLIPSANDAAYALAEHVAGSVQAFADLCNKRAKALGCENLHFVNPNGIHDDDHYCSAYDLYLIAAACRKHDVFNEIVCMKECSVPPTGLYTDNDRTFENTNELLLPSSRYFDPHCTGIKTGRTTPAGECLIAACSDAHLDLISVVLGGKATENGNERFTDTKKLFSFVYDNYAYKLIADKRKLLAEVNIDNAKKNTPVLHVLLQTDVRTVAPKGVNADNVITQIDLPEDLKAPIRKDQVLGTVTYRVDGLIYSANLVAGNDVAKKPFRLYNTLVALAALVVFVCIFRTARKHKAAKSAGRKQTRLSARKTP